MVEGSFSFGRNNPYQPDAMETDTKVAASYEESIACIWFCLPLFSACRLPLFALASVRRIVKRALNLAVDACNFLPLASQETISLGAKAVEDVFHSETSPCPRMAKQNKILRVLFFGTRVGFTTSIEFHLR